jgi:hypothetical protein
VNPPDFNLPLSPSGVAAFLFPFYLCRSAFPIGRHLRFNLHAAVEFMLCDAALAVGVAFLLDGVEDASEFG